MFGDGLHGAVEAGEDNGLLTLFDDVFEEIDGRLDLGGGELFAGLGELGEQTDPVAITTGWRAIMGGWCLLAGPGEEETFEDLAHLGSGGPFRNRHLEPGPQLGRKVEDLLLAAPDHDAVELEREFLQVACPVGDPAIVVLHRVAVALGKGQKAPAQGVAHELEEREEVARAVGEGGAGEGVDDRIGTAFEGQAAGVPAALAPVVLQVVRLVEDDPLPGESIEFSDPLAEEVVVDDGPAREVAGEIAAILAVQDLAGRFGVDLPDFALPVQFDGSGADDEVGSLRFGVAQGHDRLAGFPQTHVVGEDGAAPGEEKGDPLDLVGEEALGQGKRFPEGRIVDLGRRSEGGGGRFRSHG